MNGQGNKAGLSCGGDFNETWGGDLATWGVQGPVGLDHGMTSSKPGNLHSLTGYNIDHVIVRLYLQPCLQLTGFSERTDALRPGPTRVS